MRLTAASSFAALATLAAACGTEPPPAPKEIPTPPASAAVIPAASVAATTTPPAVAAATPSGKVLEVVGGVTTASFAPAGFDRLTAPQRVLAYHLAQAVLAGDPLFTMQTSRYGWPATELTMKLLAQ